MSEPIAETVAGIPQRRPTSSEILRAVDKAVREPKPANPRQVNESVDRAADGGPVAYLTAAIMNLIAERNRLYRDTTLLNSQDIVTAMTIVQMIVPGNNSR